MLKSVYQLMERMYEDLDFVPGATTTATPLSEMLQKRREGCQDYAHLMIGAQGLPARYVSKYIETIPPPGQKTSGHGYLPRLVF